MAEIEAKERIKLAEEEINKILEKYELYLDVNWDNGIELSDDHSRQFKVIK